ncbi:MAG TPA: ABC transporter transmembrane domain-containing protein, partial [Coleofasciculaceae cyanobacterium]
MAEIDAQVSLLLRKFFETWPFNHLPAQMRKPVALKLQLCSFRPGQFICPPNELPSAVHCIVQGRVRILGAMSYQSPTLAVVGTGTVVGWDSLLRRVASGSARAAAAESAAENEQEVLTIALPADEFEKLALQHLMPALSQQVSLSELFDTLSCFLSTMPSRFSGVNLKDVVQYIEQEQLAVLQSWRPNQPGDGIAQSAAEQIWLVSGGAPLNVPIGTPVTTFNQLQQIRPSLFPVRLIGIERTFLASALLSGAIPNPELDQSTSDLQLLPSTGDWSQPPIVVQSNALVPPTVTVSPQESATRIKSYPIRRSPVPDLPEDVIACFGMICELLQVPYRPDTLRRSLRQRSLDKFEPLDLCVRIAQAVGLNAQVVHITPTAGGLNRLSLPAIVRCHDVLTVVYEVTPTLVTIGSPRTGLLRLPPHQLAERLIPDTAPSLSSPTATCEAVVIERLARTPTKRFGFGWFIPTLKAQTGILTQVLIASVFIQVLGLANPLLVQQVIDKVIINANIGVVPMFGALLIMFAFLEGVLTILRMYLFASTTTRLDLRLSLEIVRHMLRLPLNFFEKRPVGEISARLSELENVRQFLTGTALTAVLDVLFSLMYVGVMFLYSPTLTFCVLLTIPVIVVSTLVVASIQKKLIRTKADHNAKVQSYLVEVLSGIFTVKAQNMESLVEATWRDRYVNY